MNVYVVVEGRVVEKEVYTVWIPQINNALAVATYIDDVRDNNFYIVSGNGYPSYFDILHAALEDVASASVFDRLVVCVDSEDMEADEKRDELTTYIESTGYGHVDYRIVIQHFCFETWALGNRKIGSCHPQNEALRKYRRLYNVHSLDPEGLPALPDEHLNRSQFAEKYLRLILNDRNKKLSYSRSNPRVVAHPKYLHQVRSRLEEIGHIQSFRDFLNAFA